jgi:hypothetical protein
MDMFSEAGAEIGISKNIHVRSREGITVTNLRMKNPTIMKCKQESSIPQRLLI